jgi:TolB-like protein/Tfp pilus assembly protein PilF/tRNA A-37 threonylcarbamoyl transferase component Bud32
MSTFVVQVRGQSMCPDEYCPPLVFISHVDEDSALAIDIARALETAGYCAWYYERDSKPGGQYLSVVGDAIDSSQAFLLLASSESMGSRQVSNELVRAYERDKPLVPVLYGITHPDLQEGQSLWRQALGATTSIQYGEGSLENLIQSIVAGLEALGIHRSLSALSVPPPSQNNPNSIAVLPFANLSSDPEQDHFCDGMAEEITNALAQVESLQVVSRTSAFAFKGKHQDVRHIGRKLGARRLLEGSVRKSGNRLRITAQLLDTTDGSHLWSRVYDKMAEDVFSVQEDIALQITRLLTKNLATMRLKRDQQFGPYLIHEPLGEGGSGEVYRALDSRSQRIVALKLIRQDLADSSEYRKRLADETQVAAGIDSAYVVRILECGEHESIPFVAMEFVGGDDLLTATSQASIESKIGLAVQVASGIASAHRAGLIHSNLKPDNVRVAPDGTAKVLDFGLAPVSRDESSLAGDLIAGTQCYAAPEQLTGGELTPMVDQFSLGLTLYEVIAGRHPFERNRAASNAYAILHEQPPPLSDIVSDMPPWVDAVITRLLEKQPADRYPDMDAVVKSLSDGLAGRSATASLARRHSKQVTVLDLRNLSGDREWDYFCEGFSDDVVSELARRTTLTVSAQPSREVGRDIPELFRRYHCDYLVTGSMLRWHETIQLRLLVHADKGRVLLAGEKFEDRAENLFGLLSAASGRVAELLSEAAGQRRKEVDESAGVDVTAYDFYLRGKNYYQTNKPENLDFAIQMFSRALLIEPQYALALTGLADVFVFQYMAYYDRTSERLQAAYDHIQKALRRDPELPEAHRSLGRYYMFTGDAVKAEACFKRAIDLNPKFSIAYRSIGWLKYQTSDYESALDWAQQALQLAPTDTETLLLMALLHTYRRQYTAAMATLQRAIEIAPDYGRAHYNLGLVYLKLGVFDLAIENFHSAARYAGDPNCYIDMGYAHMMKREYGLARAAFEESVRQRFFPFVAEYFLGFLDRLENNTSDAKHHFSLALKYTERVDFSNAENVQVYGYHVMILAELGLDREVREHLNRLTAFPNLIGDVCINIARAYALIGEPQEAARYRGLALTVSPGPTEKELAGDPHFTAN